MDFLKILKSFEEFVYEALIWLVLVPRTLVRILVRPRRMAAYAASELDIPSSEERFGDAVSPPLLLILGVLVAHAIDVALRPQTPDESDTLARVIFASEQNLLLYRTIAFGVWSLAGAVFLLVREHVPINRRNLRAPFYEQCYLVAPFALILSIATSFTMRGGDSEDIDVVLGSCLAVLAALWFCVVQVDWVRIRARLPLWKSILAAALILAVGATVNAVVAHVLLGTHVVQPTAKATEH
jgi:hypothetical protein